MDHYVYFCVEWEVDVPAPTCNMVVELFYFGVYGLPSYVCDVCKGSFILSEENEHANTTLQFNRRADTGVLCHALKSSFTFNALFRHTVILY